jgi:hypothetical protein
VSLVALGAADAQAPDKAAESILRAASRAIGSEALVAGVRTIETEAACQGPRGSYETHVASARDGRAVFEQRYPDGRDERAILTAETPADSLERTMIRGHEIHMLVLAPAVVLGPPSHAVDTTFRGQPAIGVVFPDGLGAFVTAFFARRDTMPLGFELPDHLHPGAPPIALTFDAWARTDGLRLPVRAVYHQGGDEYRFRFTSVRLNATLATVFTPGAHS